MYLKSIFLSNFRNYNTLSLDLDKHINIIYGNNAQGKTNLLESIYVLAFTKSHRSFIDNNLIKNGCDNCKIRGVVVKDSINSNLEIEFDLNKKKLKIDQDLIRTVSDYITLMNIIIFYPDDLELIKGSPIERRKFLNFEISQINKDYLKILSDYNKLLKMRNDYLKKYSMSYNFDKNYFDTLTEHLIDKASYIYYYRYKFVEKLNNYVDNIFKDIMNLSDFHLIYKSPITFDKRENIKIQMKERLNHLYDVELKLSTTMFGPHKDDLEFYLGDKNLKNYGSQGQQRVAVLAIKLAEIEIIKKNTGYNPILLLDDVFSELDDSKKNNLLQYIKKGIQTIITTTDLNNIDESIMKQAKLIEISNGNIVQIKEVE